MTVVVAAAAPDGMVLAADSRTTFREGDHHRVMTDIARKVFVVHDRFAVATWGMAQVGGRTIHGLIDEFVAQHAAVAGEIDEFAQTLAAFLDTCLADAAAADGEAPPGPGLGLLVAGYDADGVGQVLEVNVPGAQNIATTVTTAHIGVTWRGQTDVIRRLIKGFDHAALTAASVTIPRATLSKLETLDYRLILPVTVSEAVEFAAFLVRTTVNMQRFSDGTTLAPRRIPACGGATQIVAVTRQGCQLVAAPADG